MNWLPQGAQAGFWNIPLTGSDRKNNVSVTIKPGGPQVQTIPQVAAGQAQFGLANADQILLARAKGVPVVAIYGTFRTYLQCLMYHPEAGIKKIRDISGHTVSVTPGPNYWLWVKQHFNLDVKTVNITGSLANYAQNKSLVQQCFITQDPFKANQKNLSHKEFLVADLGYNPYGTALFTTEKMINEHPSVVRSVVKASQQGWNAYMEHPEATNKKLVASGSEQSLAGLNYAHKKFPPFLGKQPYGTMTAVRWKTLAHQMESAKILKDAIKWQDAYTTRFIK